MKKNILKKIVALLTTFSMVGVSLINVSADIDDNGRYIPSENAETFRYYFYMPDDWYNEFTDTAGVYWWEGTDACPSWQEMYKAQVSDVENIYYIDCPADVLKVIFNNYVDTGEDPSEPFYIKGAQTADVTVGQQQDGDEFWAYFPETDYVPGDSDLYPEGLVEIDNMIYVIDKNKIDINPLNGKKTCRGEWYYYYGNSEYGYAPTKGEGAVYTGCYQSIDEAIEDKRTGVTGSTEEPTTEPVTETTTATEVPTSAPEGAPLTVTATSNFFPETTAEFDENTKEITVTYSLGLAKDMVNTEWYLTYDPEVLSFDKMKNLNTDKTRFDFMPQITRGAVYNTDNYGEINSNVSSLSMYKITDEKPFVKVVFDVIGSGETTIDLQVRVLSVGDLDPNIFQVDVNSIKYYASQYQIREVEGVAPPTKKTEIVSSTYVAPTEPEEDDSRKIYFDVESSGWTNYNDIYCHIWRADGTGDWPFWQTQKELCKKEEDGRYSYDTTKTGNIIENTDGRIYGVIFSADTGAQTCNIVMSGSCLGDTVYVTGNTFESSHDSEKKIIEATWRNNPDCGPEKTITSTGNIVGTAFFEGETDETLMADYLRKYYLDQTKLLTVQDLFDKLIIDTDDVLDEVKQKEDYAVNIGSQTYEEACAEYQEIEKILKDVIVNEQIIYDINKDKYTDVDDVSTFQMYLAGYDIEVKESKLDIYADEVVDVDDVTALQMYLAS